MDMDAAILRAIIALALHGRCLDESAYPTPSPGEVTGYHVISQCALPTTRSLTARQQRAVYAEIKGKPMERI